jgi:hypothetical protein
MISGFRRDVDEICAIMGYYAASNSNCFPTFRDNLSVPSSTVKALEFLILEDGNHRLPRNVGEGSPLDAA